MKILVTMLATTAVAAGSSWRGWATQDPVATEAAAPSALALPPIAQGHVASAPRAVPLLAGIPLVGNLFTNRATDVAPEPAAVANPLLDGQDDDRKEELARLRARLAKLEAELARREVDANVARSVVRDREREMAAAIATQKMADVQAKDVEATTRAAAVKALARDEQLAALDLLATENANLSDRQAELQNRYEELVAAQAALAARAHDQGDYEKAKRLLEENLAQQRQQVQERRAWAEVVQQQAVVGRRLAEEGRERANVEHQRAAEFLDRVRAKDSENVQREGRRAAPTPDRVQPPAPPPTAASPRERVFAREVPPAPSAPTAPTPPAPRAGLFDRSAPPAAPTLPRASSGRPAQQAPKLDASSGTPIHIHVEHGDVHIHNGGAGAGIKIGQARENAFPVQSELVLPPGDVVRYTTSTPTEHALRYLVKVPSDDSGPFALGLRGLRHDDDGDDDGDDVDEDTDAEDSHDGPHALGSWSTRADNPLATVTNARGQWLNARLEGIAPVVAWARAAEGASGAWVTSPEAAPAPAAASVDELLQLVREVHADVRALRDEMRSLRSEVEAAPRARGRSATGATAPSSRGGAGGSGGGVSAGGRGTAPAGDGATIGRRGAGSRAGGAVGGGAGGSSLR